MLWQVYVLEKLAPWTRNSTVTSTSTGLVYILKPSRRSCSPDFLHNRGHNLCDEVHLQAIVRVYTLIFMAVGQWNCQFCRYCCNLVVIRVAFNSDAQDDTSYIYIYIYSIGNMSILSSYRYLINEAKSTEASCHIWDVCLKKGFRFILTQNTKYQWKIPMKEVKVFLQLLPAMRCHW